MELLNIIIVTASAIGIVCGVPIPEKQQCEMGQYYNSGTQICTPCSECPLNHIIRQPCTYTEDTICGPFYEFEYFKFNKGGSHSDNKEDGKKDKDVNLFKEEPTKKPCQSTTDEITDQGPSVHDEARKWKELCFGLITALVMLSIIFAAYVIIAQLQMSRLHTKAKASNAEDSEDETIYCYTHLCTGVQLHNNKPRTNESSDNNNRQRALITPIYRPGRARRVRSSTMPVRASPNEYILHQNNATAAAQNRNVGGGDLTEQSSSSRLLAVIPEGSSGNQDECDHVRVIYT